MDLTAIREGLSAAGVTADGNAAALARMQQELTDQSRFLQQISDAVTHSIPVRQVGWQDMPEPDSSGMSDEVISALPEKVAVLLFASEYPGSDSLQIGREIREIQLRIQEAKFSDRIALIPWTAAQPLDLIPRLNMHNPHMVQFSGHGTPDGILMTGPATRPQPLAADRLIQMLKWSGEDLRIVFFNICDSEEHARAAAQIVDGAIGMRGEMHDTAARTFAASLYSGLAFGRSLKHAFYQACAAIGDEPDSSVPQLFFRDGTDPHEIVLVRPGHDDR